MVDRVIPPCRSIVWRGCLHKGECTVVRVVHVHDVEVGVVDCCAESLQSHFGVTRPGESFVMEGGFGGVEEGVDERAFAGVLTTQDDDGGVVELAG